MPFREGVETLARGPSAMGDRSQDLFRARSKEGAARNDVLLPLVAFVSQVLEQPPGFAPGAQQDAAECLMRILEHVDRG
eukprot:9697979-Lingulodinium_polyedra.AAC.1